MKKLITYITLVFGFLLITQVALSQPPPPPQPEAVPIDGGLSLLAAAGAALGAKKIWDARKNKKIV
jgi:hypothetical protein